MACSVQRAHRDRLKRDAATFVSPHRRSVACACARLRYVWMIIFFRYFRIFRISGIGFHAGVRRSPRTRGSADGATQLDATQLDERAEFGTPLAQCASDQSSLITAGTGHARNGERKSTWHYDTPLAPSATKSCVRLCVTHTPAYNGSAQFYIPMVECQPARALSLLDDVRYCVGCMREVPGCKTAHSGARESRRTAALQPRCC